MTEAEIIMESRELKGSDLPEKYGNKCFACGSPVEWYQDICDACQKLTELHCT